MAYKQLTRDQRYLIYGLWRSGHSQTEIARELGVHKSTIGREIKRNSRWNGYYPEQAQAFCDMRRKHAKKNVRFTKKVEDFVRKNSRRTGAQNRLVAMLNVITCSQSAISGSTSSYCKISAMVESYIYISGISTKNTANAMAVLLELAPSRIAGL